jgi:crotonobetainyl-CoA:carnitine CoA-transferase CaiB-like acyl-CoA transferase
VKDGGFDNKMFEGVRIVELAQFVFVPAASTVLSDLGAEVIHVEPISGDPYRTLKISDGRQTKSANLSMEQNNRGKKSVAIDLKTNKGRELFLKLIETADIFLTSLRPAALERLSLTRGHLLERNPKLIYAHGNGLGFRGEEADRPGYDASCFWARGGFAHGLSGPGEAPTRPRPALGDHTGAMNIAFGMAAALYRRERTGQAVSVEVSLLSSAMWVLSADVCTAQALTSQQQAHAATEGFYALKRAYRTLDGRFIQLMFLDPERYWPELCRRVERTEMLSDPRFADIDARNESGGVIIAELDAAFGAKTLADWRVALRGWDAPWEVVQTLQELAIDPQALANGYTFTVKVADGNDITVVSGPVSFNGSAVPIDPRPAPGLGEHTGEILQSLGVDDDDLAECRRQRIVA